MNTNKLAGDRELLELAAKAAGVVGTYQHWTDSRDNLSCGIAPDGSTGSRWWNPLHDDGAALRLAVHLEIGALVSANFVYVKKYYSDEPILRLPIGRDKYAASRRAIVMAAAEIGSLSRLTP